MPYGYNGFLEANPDITRMLQNDTSLGNICTPAELQRVNVSSYQIPLLCANSEICFPQHPMTTVDFMHVMLYMVVNGLPEYTIHYNLSCKESDIQSLMGICNDAFELANTKYVHYLSCIKSLQTNVQMQMLSSPFGKRITNFSLSLKFMESYAGAFNENLHMLKLVPYILNQLNSRGKLCNSQYENARVLYNWLCLHCEYDFSNNPRRFGGFSALLYGKAVCEGFTCLYNALCSGLGISIMGMSGQSRNVHSGKMENHIWSWANLNGRSCYIDSTWGSPNFSNPGVLLENGINPRTLCDFKYFDIPYHELAKEHFWDKSIYG